MNNFIKNFVIPELDYFLKMLRIGEFEDYRARNFQDDLRRAMEELYDWYKKEYNL